MQITTEKLEFYEELEKKYDALSDQNVELRASVTTSQKDIKAFKCRVEAEVREVLIRDYDLSESMVDLCDSLGLDLPMQTLTIEVEIPFGATIDSITDSNGDSVSWVA